MGHNLWRAILEVDEHPFATDFDVFTRGTGFDPQPF